MKKLTILLTIIFGLAVGNVHSAWRGGFQQQMQQRSSQLRQAAIPSNSNTFMSSCAPFAFKSCGTQPATNYLIWAIAQNKPAKTAGFKSTNVMYGSIASKSLSINQWITGILQGYAYYGTAKPDINGSCNTGACAGNNNEFMSGQTPLMVACKYNEDAISVLLGAHSLKVNECQYGVCGQFGPYQQASSYKININATDHNGKTALMYAAQHLKNPSTFTNLMNVNGINYNLQSNEKDPTTGDKMTALMYAAAAINKHNYAAMTKKWLNINKVKGDVSLFNQGVQYSTLSNIQQNMGLDVNVNSLVPASDPAPAMTPLQYASYYGKTDIVNFWLTLPRHIMTNPDGVSIDAKNNAGDTALIIAAQQNNADAVSALIAHGANVNAKNTAGDSALVYAVNLANNAGETVAESLINAGATASTGAELKWLLGKNPNLEGTLMAKNPAIFFNNVLEMGNSSYVSDVLSKYKSKIDVNAPVQFSTTGGSSTATSLLKNPLTPLMYSIVMYTTKNEYGAIASTLLSHGANPNPSLASLEQYSLKTPLQQAASQGASAIVSLLLANKADPNAVSSLVKSTPLMFAAAANSVPSVAALLKASGINGNAQTVYGKTALMYAVAFNNVDVLTTLLKSSSIDVNVKTNAMNTALILAVKQNGATVNGQTVNTTPIVTALLGKSGIDVNVENKFGDTALSIAESKNDTAMVTLLKQHGAKAVSQSAPPSFGN